MLSQQEIQKLNNILGDSQGRIPYGDRVGESIYQFRRMGELHMPYHAGTEVVNTASGLGVVTQVFEWRPQWPGDQRWCIAKWLEPEPHDEWLRKYGDKLDWPKHGYWYCWQPLAEGKEPNEEWVRFIADQMQYQRSMSLVEHVRKVMEREDKKEDAYKQQVRDMVADGFVNHVPGARGGSYIAFTESPKESIQ